MKGMTSRKTGRAAGLLALALLLAPAAAPVLAAVIGYEYDNLDRLTSATYDDGQRINYRYDAAGNILLVWTGYNSDVQTGPPDLNFLQVGAPAPNPFNARVVIRFEIRAAQRVKVRIYDLRGRMVRDLVDEDFAPGSVDLAWDGRNDGAASLASGMYVARIETERRTANLRMMLVK